MSSFKNCLVIIVSSCLFGVVRSAKVVKKRIFLISQLNYKVKFIVFLPVSHNPDCCKLRGLHVDLNPEVDVPFLLKPQQPDLPAKKFSAVGKSESVVERNDFVDTISEREKKDSIQIQN